jgi:hypothetical protein
MDAFRAAAGNAEIMTVQAGMPGQTGFHPVRAESMPVYSAIDGYRTLLFTPRLVCVLDTRDATAALHHVERLASEPAREEELVSTSRSTAWRAVDRDHTIRNWHATNFAIDKRGSH